MKGLPRELLLMIIRRLLQAAGVLLMAKGVLTSDDAEQFAELSAVIVGALLSLSDLAWSASRKVDRARRPADAAADPAPGPPRGAPHR